MTVNEGTELSTIIVSYNTRSITLECIRSVLEQTRSVSNEILVVDNASRDGSADAIAARFPGVTLVASRENLGFAGANNLAADRARGRYLMLLNPDTVVLDGAIEKLHSYALRTGASICGGRTVFPDGTLNPTSCWGRITLWSTLCSALGLSSLLPVDLFDPEGMPSWQRDTERSVDVVSGCFLLITRELWNRLGGFDTRYFMYGEDADLCLRAKAAGHTCMFTPDATIVHMGGASEPVREDKLVRLFAARTRLARWHWSPRALRAGLVLMRLRCWTRFLAWSALALSGRERARAAAACWRAVWVRRSEWLGPGEETPDRAC